VPESRTIVFGAFDRHNFGDLLFAHVVATLLRGHELVFAGIAARDLMPWGGHRVESLAQIAADPLMTNLVVAGGEVLTCEAWQAAVMVLGDEEASAAAVCFLQDAEWRTDWARQILGTTQRAPYAPSKSMLAHAGRLIYNAVGGVELGSCDAAMRNEVIAALRSADSVSVRDRVTQAALAAQGVEAVLVPDCAVLVAELFGDVIRERAMSGEPAAVRAGFPNGYLAVQFSADCGDDATLTIIARELDVAARESQCGIVFFRAGIAPWHDDAEQYRRAAQRMKARVHVFESVDIWDICALIAGSRGFAGTSLHGRIIAGAFRLPRVSFVPPDIAMSGRLSKQEAYASTWEMPELPGAVPRDELAAGIARALRADSLNLSAHAKRLAALCRAGCEQWVKAFS
jgi:hypothetical protein